MYADLSGVAGVGGAEALYRAAGPSAKHSMQRFSPQATKAPPPDADETSVGVSTDSEYAQMKRKEVLTTGEVAKICHVAPRTVSKWFDSGKLRGYRIPGSRDRRIPLAQLIQFMRSHGMPLEGLEGGETRVLFVDPDTDAAGSLAEKLAEANPYEAEVAANGFEAGMRAERLQPHVVFVDILAEGLDADEILKNLRVNPSLETTRVVAVGGALTAGQKQALTRQGFDAVTSKPYDLDQLVSVIEEATNLVA